jgi:hypothetical protein
MDTEVQDNTSNSLRLAHVGIISWKTPLFERRIIHFDHEHAPERVVHALGHGAYGTFQSYDDWSNVTSACWLRNGSISEAFTLLGSYCEQRRQRAAEILMALQLRSIAPAVIKTSSETISRPSPSMMAQTFHAVKFE